MLTRRVIPCLDVRGGTVVKGVRFQGLRDVGDPAELAARYERDGADEITLLDVSATVEEREHALDTVASVRAGLSIPLTIGGGVRTPADVSRLLDVGADKVSLNTAAVTRPELVDDTARRFGSQCAVVAVDARAREGGWTVLTHSGRTDTGRDLVEWCREVADRGAGELLLTSWDRDGTGLGYDLDLLAAVCSAVPVPVIASGGAAADAHFVAAFEAGADAILAASVFHDGVTTVAALKTRLLALGCELRPAAVN